MTQNVLIESGSRLLLEDGSGLLRDGLFADLSASATLTADLWAPQSHALEVSLSATPSLAADLTSYTLLSASISTVKILPTLTTEAGDYLTTEGGFRIIEDGFYGPTLTASLSTGINLEVGLYATATVTADLELRRNLSALLQANASVVTAILSSQKPIYASLSANPTLTASLTLVRPLTASLTAEASVSADLESVRPLAASLTASASITAALEIQIQPEAALQAVASVVSANLTSYRALEASLSTTPAITTAELTTGKPINAVLRASPTLSAALTTNTPLQASLSARASMTNARLTVTQFTPTFTGVNQTIFLAEIKAFDTVAQAETTLYFSSHQGYDRAGQWYAPRIENPANLTRSIGAADMGGRASMSYGELTLVNNDDVLDLSQYYFDGRELVIKQGREDDEYALFETILVATMDSIAIERERISLRLRDRSVTLEKPFSEVKYLGNNALPQGVEGSADDIKDQAKPRLFGRVALMAPVQVNTSKLIYQVNNGPVDRVINVFDSGAYLSPAAVYASESEMLAVEPAKGTWRAYPQGGFFRLGSPVFGQCSACVAESFDWSRISAAGIIERLLAEFGMTDIVTEDFAALQAANAAPLGVVVEDGETVASLLDRICESVGAWWGFDRFNRFRIMRLQAPAGTPALTLTDDDLIEIERQPDERKPLWQTVVQADRNYVRQDKKSLAGIVPENRAAWFGEDTRDQKAQSADTKGQRLLSTEDTFESLLNGIAAAKAESERRLALLNGSRELINVTVGGTPGIDLGDLIDVRTSKLNLDAGKLFAVTSVAVDYAANITDLTLFG